MTVDLFPQEPPSTQYSPAFEACWKSHPVGTKKTAWKAGEKNEWSDANWVWLERYLVKRWKEDAKWNEGTYIPHLSSIINGERWTDSYKKLRQYTNGASEEWSESHEEAMAKIRIAQEAYKK